MTTFFLVRHGSCDGLGEMMWGRTAGVCLNNEGKAQAQRLGERFNGLELAAVYSSPLERALETAAAIARPAGIEIKQHQAFNEIDFGEWSGKSLAGLAGDDRWRRFNTQRSVTKIPGGESFLDVQARVVSGLEQLSEHHDEAQLVIVSHADVIKAAVGYVTATPIDLLQRIEISPCSVSTIAIDKHGPRLLGVNNRSELV